MWFVCNNPHTDQLKGYIPSQRALGDLGDIFSWSVKLCLKACCHKVLRLS